MLCSDIPIEIECMLCGDIPIEIECMLCRDCTHVSLDIAEGREHVMLCLYSCQPRHSRR